MIKLDLNKFLLCIKAIISGAIVIIMSAQFAGAQIISTNGVYISISSGTTMIFDTINTNASSTLNNSGIISLRTINNSGNILGSGTYNVNRNFINNGSFTANSSTVNFNGTATQIIGGISAIIFNNATNSNIGGSVTALTNITANTLDNGGASNVAAVLDLGVNSLNYTSVDNTGAAIRFSGPSNGKAIPSGTVEYSGTVQTVATGTYNHLAISGSGNIAMAGAVTANGNLLLTAGTLSIGANLLTLNGAVSGSGTINGSSNSNLTIGGTTGSLNFTAGARTLKNLTLNSSSSATLGTSLDITAGSSPGTLIVNSGATLTTAGNLTLKSDINGTARVGSSAGTISGNVTVERYIKLGSTTLPRTGKAWRLLTMPVTGTSINAAWQEGNIWNGSSAESSTGYGTLITGLQQGNAVTANGNGFDFWSSIYNSTSSIRYHSGTTGPQTGAWLTYSSINGVAADNKEGYLLYIRGDRSISTSGVGATILRAKGILKQGTRTPAVIASATSTFTLIGNPYASAIDFESIYTNNSALIQPRFTIWDANLNVNGGYRLVTRNAANNYSVNPAGPSASTIQYIQSGQAIFVEAISSGGNLTIQEGFKSSLGNDAVFFQGGTAETTETFMARGGAADTSITINLNIKNTDSTVLLADGVKVGLSAKSSKKVKGEDARKAFNFSENLSVAVDTFNLIFERRPPVSISDTIFLKLWGTGIKNYRFDISASGLKGKDVQLKDKYLNTSSALNSDGSVNTIDFSITSDTNSKAIDRFYITTAGKTVLPNLALKNSNESNGQKIQNDQLTSIKAYPNPVNGSKVSVLISSLAAGVYELSVYSSEGRKMFIRKFKHKGGNLTDFIAAASWSAGIYTIQLTNEDGLIVKQIPVLVN